MKLSIILPVYNKVNTIREIIQRIKEVSLDLDKEIIIVDDGSTDGTSEILQELDKTGLKVIYHYQNLGLGAAIRTAQAIVNGDFVIIQKPNLEDLHLEVYPHFLKLLIENKTPIAYTIRTVKDFSFKTWFIKRCICFLVNLLYQTRISEVNPSVKVFSAAVFKRINIRSTHYGFEAELLAKILKQGIKIIEVPTTSSIYSNNTDKKINWKESLYTIWTLIKYKFVD